MATKKRAAKRTARKTSTVEDSAAPMRICFERIIPDDQDPERPVRRAMRDQLVKSAGKKLNAEEVHTLSRMALVNSKKWANGASLRVRFLDGSSKMRKSVEKHAHHWEDHANIKF